MNEPVEIFLGFDPGGIDSFGWSICQAVAEQFEQRCSGVANNAGEVVAAVLNSLPPNARVLAAGIDAPLFWNRTGAMYRVVDGIIQGAGGNPVAINGLRGAVLAQGVLLAGLLRQHFGNLAITETFPSALRGLLDPVPTVLELCQGEALHQQDARTAAYAAWAMWNGLDGWRNLFWAETDPFLLLEQPVSYWMPIQETTP